jgi:hypothetical protein
MKDHVTEVYDYFIAKFRKIETLTKSGTAIDHRSFEDLLNAFTSFLNKFPLKSNSV